MATLYAIPVRPIVACWIEAGFPGIPVKHRVLRWVAGRMLGSLKNFPIDKRDLAIRCVLDTIVDELEEEVDWL